MTQVRIRMRKLARKTREKITTTPKRDIKRESRREGKAVKAVRSRTRGKGVHEDLNGEAHY